MNGGYFWIDNFYFKFNYFSFQALLVYVSAFYFNMGNYRNHGDSKFIPNLPVEKLEKLIKSSKCYQMDKDFMDKVWENIKGPIYSLKLNELSLGFQPNGTTTYWSMNMTEEDAKIVDKFLAKNVSINKHLKYLSIYFRVEY